MGFWGDPVIMQNELRFVTDFSSRIASPLAEIRNALQLAREHTSDPAALDYLSLADFEVMQIAEQLLRIRSEHGDLAVAGDARHP